ncbi:hypothetical protein JFL43_17825 [Viridibacillus sp. YIM B01967]|uniref:N-acetyltransferase domain-containing protein n=1 Tax=Viridibacillus soli TaxID=2798301 RepID=A0ABS1HBJ1_9BACL|nr:hypothetical protein [Viridibacillus soli]MBK3496686.1 hypothetical protein [Viridibacillus soli]
MDIEVVNANMKDFDAVNVIVKEGQDEHSKALPHIFKAVDQVMPQSYFYELLEGVNSEILVAKIDEEVVGFAVIEIIESPPFYYMTPRKYAYMVIV